MVTMNRGVLASWAVGLFLVGCAGAPGESVASDEGAVSESANTVAELDALVDDINGYASLDAWTIEHARAFSDDLDDRFLQDETCSKLAVNEAKLRGVTRDRGGDKRVRKLDLSYASHEGDVMVSSHQSYHYDASGHLRVVVIDREEDHMLDEPFMREVDAFNARVKAEHDKLPVVTETDKVLVSNKLLELRTASRVIQYRLYFREDGSLFAETKSEDLDHARALDFEAIPQMPPTLYSDMHPANVVGTPYFTRLFPSPTYAFRPIARTHVPVAESMRGTLIAANPSDGEASLAAKPVCR